MNEIPNLSYINQVSKGNVPFVKTILTIIKKELTEEVEVYRSNLELQNFEMMAANVHKLNHKIRILGLKKGGAIAEAYKNDLLENNLSRKLDFESILASMMRFIEKVKI